MGFYVFVVWGVAPSDYAFVLFYDVGFSYFGLNKLLRLTRIIVVSSRALEGIGFGG